MNCRGPTQICIFTIPEHTYKFAHMDNKDLPIFSVNWKRGSNQQICVRADSSILHGVVLLAYCAVWFTEPYLKSSGIDSQICGI